MSELAVTLPEANTRWTRVVVATTLLVAAIVVAIALFWPTGGGVEPANRIDIPQRLITQAEQERAAWGQVEKLIAEQQSRDACRMGRPC